MNWIASIFSKKSGKKDKYFIGAGILVRNDFDVKRCSGELESFGLSAPEMLRLLGLIPIACGRRIFNQSSNAPAYSPYYIVTNNGRSQIQVVFDTCPVFKSIESFLDTLGPAGVAAIGAGSCETLAINDALNHLEGTANKGNLREIRVYPPELLF